MGTGEVGIHRARFAHRHELNRLLSKDTCPDGVLLGQRRDFLFFKRLLSFVPQRTAVKSAIRLLSDQPDQARDSWQ